MAITPIWLSRLGLDTGSLGDQLGGLGKFSNPLGGGRLRGAGGPWVALAVGDAHPPVLSGRTVRQRRIPWIQLNPAAVLGSAGLTRGRRRVRPPGRGAPDAAPLVRGHSWSSAGCN